MSTSSSCDLVADWRFLDKERTRHWVSVGGHNAGSLTTCRWADRQLTAWSFRSTTRHNSNITTAKTLSVLRTLMSSLLSHLDSWPANKRWPIDDGQGQLGVTRQENRQVVSRPYMATQGVARVANTLAVVRWGTINIIRYTQQAVSARHCCLVAYWMLSKMGCSYFKLPSWE